MEQITTYRHLQAEGRMTMAGLHQQGSSMRAMARMLGRSASTISREFRRNMLAALPYASQAALLNVRRITLYRALHRA